MLGFCLSNAWLSYVVMPSLQITQTPMGTFCRISRQTRQSAVVFSGQHSGDMVTIFSASWRLQTWHSQKA